MKAGQCENIEQRGCRRRDKRRNRVYDALSQPAHKLHQHGVKYLQNDIHKQKIRVFHVHNGLYQREHRQIGTALDDTKKQQGGK